MNRSIILYGILFIPLLLQSQTFEKVEEFDLPPLEVRCTITVVQPHQRFYQLSWEIPSIDSAAAANGRLPDRELHCFIYDSKRLLGHYRGVTAPKRHCFFNTEDSVVEVFFRLRKMRIDPNDTSRMRVVWPVYSHSIGSTPQRGHEYNSVFLSKDATVNERIILTTDPNTVTLTYGMPPRLDGIGQPTILGRAESMILSLDKYYVNLKTGRILPGSKWIRRKGIRKMVEHHGRYRLIVPAETYTDLDNQEVSGYELIDAGNLRIKKYDLKQFINCDLENYAY